MSSAFELPRGHAVPPSQGWLLMLGVLSEGLGGGGAAPGAWRGESCRRELLLLQLGIPGAGDPHEPGAAGGGTTGDGDAPAAPAPPAAPCAPGSGRWVALGAAPSPRLPGSGCPRLRRTPPPRLTPPPSRAGEASSRPERRKGTARRRQPARRAPPAAPSGTPRRRAPPPHFPHHHPSFPAGAGTQREATGGEGAPPQPPRRPEPPQAGMSSGRS